MLSASCSFTSNMNIAPGQQPPTAAADVAEKVMRRVEIAKVRYTSHTLPQLLTPLR